MTAQICVQFLWFQVQSPISRVREIFRALPYDTYDLWSNVDIRHFLEEGHSIQARMLFRLAPGKMVLLVTSLDH